MLVSGVKSNESYQYSGTDLTGGRRSSVPNCEGRESQKGSINLNLNEVRKEKSRGITFVLEANEGAWQPLEN
jgi:hypothetical protein